MNYEFTTTATTNNRAQSFKSIDDKIFICSKLSKEYNRTNKLRNIFKWASRNRDGTYKLYICQRINNGSNQEMITIDVHYFSYGLFKLIVTTFMRQTFVVLFHTAQLNIKKNLQ